VDVNLSSAKIFVRYIPTILSQMDIRNFLKKLDLRSWFWGENQ